MKMCGVCIITNDVIRLSEFYSVIFSIKPVGDNTHASFDDMQLAIWNPGNVKVSPIKNISLMYYVEDIEMEYKRLSKYPVIRELTNIIKQPWGVRSFNFNDPDGNIVNFIEMKK